MKTMNVKKINDNALTNDQLMAIITLFHAVNKVDDATIATEDINSLVKYGLIPAASDGLAKITSKQKTALIEGLGIKTVDWTTSFHKSWDKVATAPIEQLIVEQIINYFSTYGMESLGMKAANFVPMEKILVDVEGIPAKESFTVVHVLTMDEIKENIIHYLNVTTNPNKHHIELIKSLLPLVRDQINLNDVKSFELKIMLCDELGLVPVDAQDFLRYMVYQASNKTSTVLIKNANTVNMLKSFAIANSYLAEDLFAKADLVALSKNFYRFKSLFLAFKNNYDLAPTINRIRRLAKKNHTPVSGKTASNLMNLLIAGKYDVASEVLEKADVRTLVKLVNFANNADAEKVMYNIRNGKSYVIDRGEFIKKNKLSAIFWLKENCTSMLKKKMNDIYKDMTFYIPAGLEYVVPTSEKQMSGAVPYGTRVVIPEDATGFCVGGHWFNLIKNKSEVRVDLDFHLTGASSGSSYGWNSSYRSDDTGILFSGDMTNAPYPNGAVEAFRIDKSVDEALNLSVNIYNVHNENVPYELIFTKDITDKCDFNKEHAIAPIIDPANAIAPVLKLVAEGDNTIGFFNNNMFTVYGGGLGAGSVPHRELKRLALDAMISRCKSMMTLAELITIGGGTVVSTLPENGKFVDLTCGNLTATTLFDVVDCNVDNLVVTDLDENKTEEVENSAEAE